MSDDVIVETPAPEVKTYQDEDLVYVDPDLRLVIGPVQFLPNGKAKSLPVPEQPVEEKEGTDPAKAPKRRHFRTFYPWGTYRTMKKIYKLEGKVYDQKQMIDLETAIAKSSEQPFWD